MIYISKLVHISLPPARSPSTEELELDDPRYKPMYIENTIDRRGGQPNRPAPIPVAPIGHTTRVNYNTIVYQYAGFQATVNDPLKNKPYLSLI